jgi:hypothetical protein
MKKKNRAKSSHWKKNGKILIEKLQNPQKCCSDVVLQPHNLFIFVNHAV